MFSKSKINTPGPKQKGSDAPMAKATETTAPSKPLSDLPASAPKAKPPASVLSSDLVVKGNMKTTGEPMTWWSMAG